MVRFQLHIRDRAWRIIPEENSPVTPRTIPPGKFYPNAKLNRQRETKTKRMKIRRASGIFHI